MKPDKFHTCVCKCFIHMHVDSVYVYTLGIGVRKHLHVCVDTYVSFICFIHFAGNLVSNRFLMLLFLNRVFEKNL